MTPFQQAYLEYREKLDHHTTREESAAFRAGWHTALAMVKEWLTKTT